MLSSARGEVVGGAKIVARDASCQIDSHARWNRFYSELMRWYTGDPTYDTLLTAALAFAVLVFIVSWYLPSPYGRFASGRFGISVGPRLGWFLMKRVLFAEWRRTPRFAVACRCRGQL
jgi:hypothetical protein